MRARNILHPFNHLTASAALIALLATLPAQAATRYWDGGSVDIGTDGNGGSTGGTGIWDTNILNWDQGSALPHTNWVNAAGDSPSFGGAAGTVTLGSDITIGTNTFNINSGTAASPYTIAGGNGPYTLTIPADAKFGAGGYGIITAPISGGTTKISKAFGTGTLWISGTTAFGAGATTVSLGVLRIDTTALGTGNLDLDGGVLGLTANMDLVSHTRTNGTGAGAVQWTGDGGFAAYGATRAVKFSSASINWSVANFIGAGHTLILGAADSDATLNWQQAISLAGSARTVQVNNGLADVDAIMSGNIGGGSSGTANEFIKTGTGTLAFTGSNSHWGPTTVSNGTLQVGSGSTSGILSVNSASTFVATNAILAVNRTDTVSQNSGGGLGNGAAVISGEGGFAQNGSGTTILTLANTFSGPVSVNNGTLSLSNLNAVANASSITIAGGATLIPNLSNIVINAAITLGAVGTTSQINAPSSGSSGQFQPFTLNGPIGGNGNLLLYGAAGFNTSGTILLGAQSTYAGNTVLDTAGAAGSGQQLFVNCTVANALPATTVLTLAGGTGSGSGRTLQFNLNGYDQTIAGLTNFSPVTSTTVGQTARNQRVNNTGALATLTISNNADYTFGFPGLTNIFSGNLVSPKAQIIGAIALTKKGTGTQTLISANTYTGDTTISEGTLALGSFVNAAGTTSIGSINGSPNIIVGTEPGSAAILDVTAAGITIGAAQILKGHGTVNGSVTLNGTLSPGTSIGTLTLSNDLVLNAGSTNTFEVDGSIPTNDVVALGAAVTYGGVLQIVPTGSFTNGQTFALFNGAGATTPGNFDSLVVNPPISGTSFTFTNGVLTAVVASGPSGPATLTNSVSGNTVTLTWPAGQGWTLKSQTNSLSTGLNADSNAWFAVPGGIDGSNSITLDPANPAVFYRLVY